MRLKSILNNSILARGAQVVLSACLLLGLTFPAAQAADGDVVWKVHCIGDQRIGYGRTQSRLEKRGDTTVRITEASDVMTFLRFKNRVTTKINVVVEELENGQFLGFTYRLENPPAKPTAVTGRVNGKTLDITTEVDGKKSTGQKPIGSHVKGPAWVDRWVSTVPLPAGAKREVFAFEATTQQVVKVTQTAAPEPVSFSLLDGTTLQGEKVTTQFGNLLSVDLYLDEKSQVVRETASIMNLSSYRVSQSDAQRSLEGSAVDLTPSLMVRVSPIPDARGLTRAVYQVHVTRGTVRDLFATTAFQTTKETSPDTATISVQSSRQPIKGTETADKRLSAPSTLLQSDDPLVKKHAATAAGMSTESREVAVKLERWVSENLNQRNFSTLLASAAEVARDLSGDCTEHAVLLAAMARARGIPARLAVGLVYGEREAAFVGHMWTELLIDGTWTPFDATQGRGYIAADHIKATDISATDENPLTLVELLPLFTSLDRVEISLRERK